MKAHIEKVVSKVLGVIILVAIFFVFIYNYPMSAVKASESADEDRNIVISEDGNSVKCLFSEESLFFEKYTADYVILQDSDVLTYSKNHKKNHLFRKQYGIEFSAISDGTARVLVTLHAADGLLEEALLYDISVEDKSITGEKLEHLVPGYAARKGVAKTVKQLMVEEYGFSEDEVSTLF